MSEEVVLTTFQSLRRRLNRLASGWLHNDDDASDVLQEAFVRLWTSYRHVDEPREVEALSIRVVRNACADMLRKKQSLFRFRMIPISIGLTKLSALTLKS